VVSFSAGILLGPLLKVIDPLNVAQGLSQNVDAITYSFSRLVLGVQLVIAGIQLPQRYLFTEWKSLTILLLPVLSAMWLCSSVLIWLVIPGLPFSHALAIGACVSPTDPVLSSSIVKGGFAEKNVPEAIQQIIIAESGANDGLGYPFLFIPLFWMYHNSVAEDGTQSVVWPALQHWVMETWLYVILLSVVYGAIVGWIAKALLRRAYARFVCVFVAVALRVFPTTWAANWESHREYVDRESYTVFAISLAVSGHLLNYTFI
jgi:sodium/hydrogen antiporter